MVNKKQLFSLTLILILLLIFPQIYAANDIIDEIEGTLEKTEEIVDTLTDPSESKEYLKQEWLKIIDKEPLKSTINIINKFFKTLNPVWKFVLGLEYTFTWLFILTLITFTTLIEVTLNLTSVLAKKLSNKYAIYTEWIVGIALVALIIITNIPKLISILIVGGISGKGPWWMQILFFIIAIIAYFFLIQYLEKTRKNDIRKMKVRMWRLKKSSKKTAKKTKEKTKALVNIILSRERKEVMKEKEKEEQKAIEEEAEETLGGISSEE